METELREEPRNGKNGHCMKTYHMYVRHATYIFNILCCNPVTQVQDTHTQNTKHQTHTQALFSVLCSLFPFPRNRGTFFASTKGERTLQEYIFFRRCGRMRCAIELRLTVSNKKEARPSLQRVERRVWWSGRGAGGYVAVASWRART